MSEAAPAPAIPYIPGYSGVIDLGPSNGSALKRLANYAQSLINSGEEIPKSPFIEWAADRVTGEDRQDLVFFLQGRRGSGKSYSCLWIGKRLAEAIARRIGGTWKDYFSLKNVATLEDTDSILKLLSTVGKYQIVLVDDCSLAISNRSWNSPENRNFNALLSVCRTNRWILLLTAPLKKHTDNQVRDMVDLNGTVYKPFHKGGFNVLKITSSEISPAGKEYTRRLNFGKRKIDFWVTFKPDKELTAEYDKQRDQSALDVNQRIITTGSFKGAAKKEKPAGTLAERNADAIIQKQGDAIAKYMKDNPGASMNQVCAKFGHSYQLMSRVVTRIKDGAKV